MGILEDQKLTGIYPIDEDHDSALNKRRRRIRSIDFTDITQFTLVFRQTDYLYEYELYQIGDSPVHLYLRRDLHRDNQGDKSTRFSWTERPNTLIKILESRK